jgi:hypothetical protein
MEKDRSASRKELERKLKDSLKFQEMFQTIANGYKHEAEWLKMQIQKGESNGH